MFARTSASSVEPRAKASDVLPPAEPDPGRARHWLREHLVVPALLYLAFMASLYFFLTDMAAWVPGPEIRGPAATGPYALSPDGRLLLTVGADSARVWDTGTGTVVHDLRGKWRNVRDAAFTPDGARITTVHALRGLCVWDAATGRLVGRLDGHERGLWSAAFFDGGWRAVTMGGPDDGMVLVRDLMRDLTPGLTPDLDNGEGAADRSGSARGRTEGAAEAVAGFETDAGGRRSLAASPGGRLVAVGTSDGCAEIWDVRTGERLFDLFRRAWRARCRPRPEAHSRPDEGPPPGLAFSPDGALLAVTSAGVTKVYDVTGKGRPRGGVRTAGRPLSEGLRGRAATAGAACWSPDGGRIVTADRHAARVWDARTGACLANLAGRVRAPGTDEATAASDCGAFPAARAVAFSPDGERILAAWGGDATSGALTIWDASTYRPLAVLGAPGVCDASFSPDGGAAPRGGVAAFSEERQLTRVWRRRRPEAWWGVTSFARFWIASGVGCAFGVSLCLSVRRRRSA